MSLESQIVSEPGSARFIFICDGYEDDVTTFKFLGQFIHVRERRDAWKAPGRGEVHDDDFSCQVRSIDILRIKGRFVGFQETIQCKSRRKFRNPRGGFPSSVERITTSQGALLRMLQQEPEALIDGSSESLFFLLPADRC